MQNTPHRAHPEVSSQPSANPESDATNPQHYTRLDPEPITVIEGWGLDFCLGNTLKYISRAGHKPGIDSAEDLAKAAWYLNRARKHGDDASFSDELTLVSREYLDHLQTELVERDAEVERLRIVAKVAGDRIRDLENLHIDCGLAELQDNALATHAVGCRCARCVAQHFDLGDLDDVDEHGGEAG